MRTERRNRSLHGVNEDFEHRPSAIGNSAVDLEQVLRDGHGIISATAKVFCLSSSRGNSKIASCCLKAFAPFHPLPTLAMEGESVNELPGAIFTIPMGNEEDEQKDNPVVTLFRTSSLPEGFIFYITLLVLANFD